MVVGICRFTLRIPENHSLKGKRKILKSLIQRLRNRFNVSVAELEDQDVWQRAVIGFSLIGNDHRFVNSCLDKVLNHVEAMEFGELLDPEIEVIHL